MIRRGFSSPSESKAHFAARFQLTNARVQEGAHRQRYTVQRYLCMIRIQGPVLLFFNLFDSHPIIMLIKKKTFLPNPKSWIDKGETFQFRLRMITPVIIEGE